MPVFDFLKQQPKKQEGKHYEEIDVEKIIPNPSQPRVIFNDGSLDELAQSIAQVGLIQPLLVRKLDDGNYELVAGERRLRAVKSLNMATVPCLVECEMGTEESAMMALIENLQRENLHYIEEAQSYLSLIKNYSLTQEQLAERVGKSQSGIANKLRLLRMPASVLQAIFDYGLSERHAREVYRLKDETEQLAAIQNIADKNLSVKETERYITKLIDSAQATGKQHPKPFIMRVMRDYKLFYNSLEQSAELIRHTGATVNIEKVERDDGVDVIMHVINPKDAE